MNKFLPVVFGLCGLIACNSKEDPKSPSEETGGPCLFDTTIKPIVIKRIQSIDSDALRIVFQVPYSTDTFDHTLSVMEYEKEFDSPAKDIQPADTFQFLELRTIAGSCAGRPQVYMKKYSQH